MRTIRNRLTYANVMSTIAVFLLLGGGAALAAGRLGKNTVGTKQIKNNAVTAAKIKKGTITGTQINLAKLGTVPSATNAATANAATTAGTANALAPMEPRHIIGVSGQPPFLDGTSNSLSSPFNIQPASFYKDHDGIVHLNGYVKTGKGEKPVPGMIFQLPPGFRPASGAEEVLFGPESTAVFIFGSNVVVEGIELSGDVWFVGGKEKAVDLSGFSFRAES